MAILSESERKVLSADGRLQIPASVTPAKLRAMKTLVERTLGGDRQAKGVLEQAISSSDAIFAYAHLTNINFLPNYDLAEWEWQGIAGTRGVADFRKPVLADIFTNRFTGLDATAQDAGQPAYVAPIVPEGSEYPYATVGSTEALSGSIAKRGFKTGYTFEAFINDSIGFIQQLPTEMLRVVGDTQTWAVYNALRNGAFTTASKLVAGTNPDGQTVVVDQVLSVSALEAALIQRSLRQVNSRYVTINGGSNLLVPIGRKRYAEFILGVGTLRVGDGANGTQVLTVPTTNLGDIDVIESPYLTGAEWALVPKPGTTVRPIVDYVHLNGYETPDLRVENVQGSYVGGGTVAPFEGSFDNDSTNFRLRILGGGVVWDATPVVYSVGTAADPNVDGIS